jgi:hypothetical protein
MKFPAITLTLLAVLVVGPVITGALGHDGPLESSGTAHILADGTPGPVDPNGGDTGWGG